MRSSAAQSVASSPELLVAQKRLLALRAAFCAQQQREIVLENEGRLSRTAVVSPVTSSVRVSETGAGFESAPFTEHIRRARQRHRPKFSMDTASTYSAAAPGRPATGARTSAATVPASPAYPSSVVLFPDLGLAMLRAKQAAAGRLWLLLRLLDQAGRGWLYLQQAQEELGKRGAPLRICGRRQLRNLLAQGEDVFWQRDPEAAGGKVRIWLRSPARVALALNCRHISARPVLLPVSTLLDGIGKVRAHFYAGLHSSRTQDDHDETAAQPIARATLRRLSAASPQTQRAYERRSAVICRVNYAIGPRRTEGTAKELAWRHGCALFDFQDRQGKHGAPGATYHAWQLPNSYAGPHKRLSRNRRRRLNKRLTDLLHKGTTGNGERANSSGDGQWPDRTAEGRRYFRDGREGGRAARAASRCACHWPSSTASRAGAFWYTLKSPEEAA